MNVAIKNALRGPYRASQRGLRSANKALLRGIRSAMGERAFLRLCGVLAEDADRTITVDGMRFDASSPILLHRAMTWRTKETDTIAWIDEIARVSDTFYDVGANVGVFSLYAAKKGMAVVALEPFFENYAALNRNIALNGLDVRIRALNVAAHNEDSISRLKVSMLLPGKAGHAFDRDAGWSDKPFPSEFRQSAIGRRLDTLAYNTSLPRPNHVKIDVDGNDHLVVEGMECILAGNDLRSVCVELVIDRPCDMAAYRRIVAAGFAERPFAKRCISDLYTQRPTNYFFVRD